ncbi:4-hydroxybenzoate octaprenyltransferase [Candidatus Pelagibacter sp.]|nr:4-hydroxybenzoate octaprenyltransferase [Candidatus Pelagibacter sp.]
MKQFKLFIELTRLKKPIGFMLLFWPCAWGLTIAYDFSKEKNTYFFYLILFLAGSILMRSAGCVVNDIIDRKYDKKVYRTKNRPIASGKVSVKEGIIYSVLLCLLAFLVLIQFNNLTIILALGSMPLAFTYPLMKRYTYWPQVFLGITFNYGLILGWTSITNEINLTPLIFYFGAIFWTLGYDTIYGFQDIKDDEIIGLKSTSIKFKENSKLFLSLCYLVFLISLTYIGIKTQYSLSYFLFLFFVSLHLFFFQLKNLIISSSSSCLKTFKSNNTLGLIVFINIFVGKFL